MNNSNDTTTSPISSTTVVLSLSDVNLSIPFQFWFLLLCEIPSVFCYAFVLTYILAKKKQREALHNHSIVVLLFMSFLIVLLDYSWIVDTLRRGTVWPPTAVFCEVWWFLDFGVYDACTVILAWASFERHILIFHSKWISRKRGVILLHYFPLIFMLVYLTVFYLYVIFFPPCENTYDFTLSVCGAYPCYLSDPFLGTFDSLLNGVIPTFLIAVFSLALIARVLWQKRHQRQNWKKCRKMAFHLIAISVLYLSMNLPIMIITIVQSMGDPNWGADAHQYLYFFCGLIQYILPFITLFHLPGIGSKLMLCFRQRHTRVMTIATVGTE